MNAEQDPLGIFLPGLFQGNTVLVTGGGRGIGKQIALAFGRLGANVVIASRNPENLDPAAEEIEATGAACLAVPTNIRKVDQVESLVEKALERFGTIDFLVNRVAGDWPGRPAPAPTPPGMRVRTGRFRSDTGVLSVVQSNP